MKFTYQIKTDEAVRKAESEKIRSKYPDRIPVVVERVPTSKIPEIDKQKFLVPGDITVAQFIWIIRKRLQLEAEQAIFIFVNRSIPSPSSTMNEIYATHKSTDGFLYIAYSGESTFGAN